MSQKIYFSFQAVSGVALMVQPRTFSPFFVAPWWFFMNTNHEHFLVRGGLIRGAKRGQGQTDNIAHTQPQRHHSPHPPSPSPSSRESAHAASQGFSGFRNIRTVSDISAPRRLNE